MARSPRGAGEKESQDCWKLLSTCEKTLLVLLVFAVTALLTLLIVLAVYLLNGPKTCTDPSCVKTSSAILDTINLDKQPCEDFEDFVCGKYLASDAAEVPESETRKKLLINSPIDANDTELITNAKRFHHACSNSPLIERDAVRSLHAILGEIGGWPVLQGQHWIEEEFFWLPFMVRLRQKGLKSDWLVSIEAHTGLDGVNYLLLGPPDLKSQSEAQKLIYYGAMVNTAVKLGSSVQVAQNELRKVLDFSQELTELSERAINSARYEKPSLVKVESLNMWPNIDFGSVLNQLSRGYAGVFRNGTLVVVLPRNYIHLLNELLMKTPRRTQANYMIWKVLEDYLPFANEALRRDYANYRNFGDRDEFCLEETLKRFGAIIDEEYLSRYMTGEMTDALKTMTNIIKNHVFDGEFESRETQVTILGATGAYSEIENLEINSDNILNIVNDINLHVEDKFYSCLNRNTTHCINKNLQDKSARTQPYFSVAENTVYIPSYLVEDDWFQTSQQNYINYAKLGWIVGNLFARAAHEKNISLDQYRVSNGLELAYTGYLHWSYKNGLEKCLPGLNFNPRELFWISAATKLCSSHEDVTRPFFEITNSTYFQTDFGCPNNS